jgi:hypothetical protein
MTIDDLDKRIKDRQQYAMDTQPLILEENEKLTESIQTAPKGQENENDLRTWGQLQADLAAAKAKIAEVTLAKDTFFDALQKANARADAAERRADDATKLVEHTRELHNICDRGLVAAWAERDQLAARVKELEFLIALDRTDTAQCTPEERKVLDAWGLLLDSALEYLRVNGSIPLSNIAVAELANRAAKAKNK